MPRFHLFGDSRHTAEQSGFFKWFMLDPVAPDTPGARLAAHYRPKGPAFHDLTEFIVIDDEDDKLQSLELRLARAFIDHPRKIHEIESLREVSVPVITAPRPEVHLPNQPTPGYQVFQGKRGRYQQRLGGEGLVLENYVRDGEPWLRIVLTAR